jgi:predicted metal-dependent hydrolase
VRDPLHEGIHLYNHGEFFEAHEVLEAAWVRAARPERFFLQSLIHAAVARYHASRDNRPGAERQLDKALRKLAGYLPSHQGVDTAALLAGLLAWRDALAAGQPLRSAKAASISFCASGPTGVSGSRTGPP